MGISRLCYNRTVDMLKDGTIKANWLTLKGTIIKGLPTFGSDAPYQVRSIAVKDACDAVRRAKLAYKATGKFHQVKFRAKKSPKQSLYLPKSAVRNGSIFVSILGKTLKSSEPIPEAKYDGRVVYEYGSWWIVLPVDTTTEIPKTKERVVSLDPGIRNFMTYYSQDSTGFIATNGWRKLLSYCHEIDKIISKESKATSSKKQNLKRAEKRLRRRVKFLRDELHWKTSVWLCKTYETIVLPALPAVELSKRTKRKITSKSVRALLTLSHGQFLQRLKYAAMKYGSSVVVVSEAYTSKTCTVCGHVHENLGGAKTFRCPNCGTKVSRDINGARNILLRAMVDKPAWKQA